MLSIGSCSLSYRNLPNAVLQVALQFPDDLLHDAVPVFNVLRARLPSPVELYILADTTYGSCVVLIKSLEN